MTEHDLRTELECEIRLAGSPEGGAYSVLSETGTANLECAIGRLWDSIGNPSAPERVVALLRASNDLRELRTRVALAIEAIDSAVAHHAVRHSAGVA